MAVVVEQEQQHLLYVPCARLSRMIAAHILLQAGIVAVLLQKDKESDLPLYLVA